MKAILFRALALLCAALPAAGCRRPASFTYPGAPVVLISIDTLRSDHLPCYGYRGVDTPRIDALRADSILFQHAFTHVPLTLPAHASLMTGLLPAAHGVRDNLGYRLQGDRHPTLARVLEQHGYATGAAVSAYVLRRETGIGEGFDFYDDVSAAPVDTESAGAVQRPGGETARALLRWIETLRRDRPFFAFLHLYEPHLPYEPPEPYRSRYASSPYDGEIATADAIVGDFLERLRRLALYDRALIVLLSDHGEGLGDHGEADHGILLYREALQVPLLLKLPRGDRRGQTDSAVVGLVDVLPTLCQAVGAVCPVGLPGASLLATAGRSPAPVISETYYPRIHLGWSELHSSVNESWHLIDGPRPELYDWKADPAERADLAPSREDQRRAMQSALAKEKGDFAQPSAIGAEEAERLHALGYLAGGAGVEDAGRRNPRDEIHVIAEIKQAFQQAARGENVAAAAALRRLLNRNPQLFDVRVKLAETLVALGRPAEAIEAYEAAAATSPSLAPDIALPLARLFLDAGRLAEARRHAALALPSQPAPAHEVLARVALAEDDLAAAEQEATQAAGDPAIEASRAVVLAEIRIRRDQPEEALRVLDAAARGDRRPSALPPNFEFLRGDALARLTRYPEAEAAFRNEIAAFPANAQAYARLAIVSAIRGRTNREVAAMLEAMFQASPRRQTALLAAKTFESLGEAGAARAWRARAAGLPG